MNNIDRISINKGKKNFKKSSERQSVYENRKNDQNSQDTTKYFKTKKSIKNWKRENKCKGKPHD